MKRLLLFLSLAVSSFAVPITITYNNAAWFNGYDPYLVGNRADFMIQSIALTTNTATNSFSAAVKFNFGNNTLSPYNLNNVAIHAADLFFTQNGSIRYGIPLVTHGGNTVNGVNTGAVVDAGDLYKVNNNNALLSSNALSSALPAFGANRWVWLLDSTNAANNDAQLVRAGTSNVQFNGTCTGNGVNDPITGGPGVCPNGQAEFTVTLAVSGGSGADWTNFINGVASGAIRPYFTGSTCGNDLLNGQVPEPGTMVLMSGALALVALRLRRRK
jgi:hypothetical protein